MQWVITLEPARPAHTLAEYMHLLPQHLSRTLAQSLPPEAPLPMNPFGVPNPCLTSSNPSPLQTQHKPQPNGNGWQEPLVKRSENGSIIHLAHSPRLRTPRYWHNWGPWIHLSAFGIKTDLGCLVALFSYNFDFFIHNDETKRNQTKTKPQSNHGGWGAFLLLIISALLGMLTKKASGSRRSACLRALFLWPCTTGSLQPSSAD